MAIGSWGTPELGITEAIGNLLGTGRTAQGGSNLTGNVGVLPTAQVASPTGYQAVYGPGLGWGGTSDVYRAGTTSNQSFSQGGSTSSSGGGGGMSEGNGGGGGGTNIPSTPSQPSYDDQINSAIEAAYNEAINLANSARSTAESRFGRTRGDIESQYGTSVSSLGTSKRASEAELGLQEGTAGQQRTDVVNAARRLYNELLAGGQQRFGGASSAGQAYGELTGREFQRSSASANTAYQNAMSQIGVAKQNLNAKYQDALMQLEQQKNTALANAQSEYEDRLLQIEQMKSTAGTEKNNRKLEALQSLRNQAYQIQLAAQQTSRALASQQQADYATLDDALSSLTDYVSQGQSGLEDLISSTTTSPETSLALGRNTSAVNQGNYTGYTAPTKDDEWLSGILGTPKRRNDLALA